jgi:MFS family permease
MERHSIMNNTKSLFRGQVIFILAAIFFAYEYVLRVLPSLLVQPLMKQFHATATQIGFLGAFYYYTLFAAQLITGPIIDRFKAQIIMTLACAVCVITGYTFTINATLGGAELSRLFMGLGSAFAFPLMGYLIQDWLTDRSFTTYAGIGSSLATLAAMGGSIGFIALMQTDSWQSIGVNLAWFGLALTILILLIVKNNHPSAPLKKSHFFINIKKLVTLRKFWVLFFITFLYFVSVTVIAALWGLSFLMQSQHLTKTQASIANACMFGGAAFGMTTMGILASHKPYHKLYIMLGCTVSAILFFTIIYLQLNYTAISVLLFLAGVFSGPVVCLFYIARKIPEQNVVGTSLALINMASLLGGIIFQPLVGHILDIYWTGTMLNGARVFSHHSYEVALVVVPLSQVLAALITIIL